MGSGIFQLCCYLIAISANAGCMDLGFIVGGKEPLSSKGIFSPMVGTAMGNKDKRWPRRQITVTCLHSPKLSDKVQLQHLNGFSQDNTDSTSKLSSRKAPSGLSPQLLAYAILHYPLLYNLSLFYIATQIYVS